MSSVARSSRSGAWIFLSLTGAGRLPGSGASGSAFAAAFLGAALAALGDLRRVSVGFLGLIVLCCLPLIPFCASIMTIIAAYTRSYREAQTYLGVVTLVPILPMMFASVMGLRPSAALMATPSMSQHFLITSLLRDEAIPPLHVLLSVGVSLALGMIFAGIAGRLYHREALLG